jgi:carotenoid 1,2-hydratase
LSDDGRHGLTLIAFLGCVFSPYYAFARRRGPADPLNHASVNVALYGPVRRWCLTERGRGAVQREPASLAIGRSRLAFDGTRLRITLDEVTAPIPGRLRGEVTVHLGAATAARHTLDARGRHRWWPIAPASRVEVRLTEPALAWSGKAYLDTNDGDEPLESAFRSWHWCRAPFRDGAAILYEVEERDGSARLISLRVDRTGAVSHSEAPPPATLPSTRLWRVPRPTRADADARPTVRQTLEDAPFYARSVVESRLFGEPVEAVHESLRLDRFTLPVVQAMLPFRMPRRLWPGR